MSFRRHLGGYAAVGALQWGIEYAVMLALSQWIMPVAPANVVGRICGATVGFWLNGAWTFAGDGRQMGSRALRRFLLVWLALTVVNTAAVSAIDHNAGLRAAQALKPAVDILIAGLGFLLSRHWIYSAR
jgi:putative flippase GtrA